jgi:hypothetical protein
MPNFNDFIITLKSDLLDFAKENLEEYKDELLKDGTQFVEKTKSDLERWTDALASEALSPQDFEFLLKGKKIWQKWKRSNSWDCPKSELLKYSTV